MQGRLLYSFNNLKDIFNSNADNFPMLCPLFRGIFLLFHFDLHSTWNLKVIYNINSLIPSSFYRASYIC